MIVEFVAIDEEYRNVYDAPVPASSLLPRWHKNKEPYSDGEKEFHDGGRVNGTTKSCSGIIDSMFMGYLFLLPCDVYAGISDEGYHYFNWKSQLYQHVDGFSIAQGQDSGLNYDLWDPVPFKFQTKWVTKTPAGYSCIIQHPNWRDDVPFWTMPGVIDTDSYSCPTNFPFVIRKDFEGLIPCGTPIAQIIPFKRDEWEHTVSVDDGTLATECSRFYRFMENGYKRECHAPKVFK